MPDLGHAHRDGLARPVDVVGFAFLRLGPVEQHFLHPVFRWIAHVNAEQVEGFACCHAVLGRPRVVDRLEYFQFDYHVFAFRLFSAVVVVLARRGRMRVRAGVFIPHVF